MASLPRTHRMHETVAREAIGRGLAKAYEGILGEGLPGPIAAQIARLQAVLVLAGTESDSFSFRTDVQGS